MGEFTIGDFDYQSKPMDAMTQFHIIQRFGPATGPLLREMIPAIDVYRAAGLAGLATALTAPPDATLDDVAPKEGNPDFRGAVVAGIDALGKALGSLSDEAAEYIMGKSLSLCQRRRSGSGTGWSDVWNKAGNCPQHNDLTLAGMMRITFFVLKENLGPFFQEVLSDSLKG